MPVALLRFILFQIIWWLLVLSPRFDTNLGLPLSTPLSLLVVLGSSYWILRGNFRSLAHRMILLVTTAGFLIDGLFFSIGILNAWPGTTLIEVGGFTVAPFWLLGLWFAFAAVSFSTVTKQWSKYFDSPKSSLKTVLILGLFGAAGGPLSYAVGEPLQILSIGSLVGYIALATEWLILFPLIVILSLRAKTLSNEKAAEHIQRLPKS